MKKAAQGFHEGLNGETSPSENCEMYMQSKKEGQRVTDLLAMFFYTSEFLLDKADILFLHWSINKHKIFLSHPPITRISMMPGR